MARGRAVRSWPRSAGGSSRSTAIVPIKCHALSIIRLLLTATTIITPINASTSRHTRIPSVLMIPYMGLLLSAPNTLTILDVSKAHS